MVVTPHIILDMRLQLSSKINSAVQKKLIFLNAGEEIISLFTYSSIIMSSFIGILRIITTLSLFAVVYYDFIAWRDVNHYVWYYGHHFNNTNILLRETLASLVITLTIHFIGYFIVMLFWDFLDRQTIPSQVVPIRLSRRNRNDRD